MSILKLSNICKTYFFVFSFILTNQYCVYAADLGALGIESAQQQKDLELIKSVQDIANNWLRRAELQHSLVGVEIMHIPSGKIIFAQNNRKRMTPASTTKLITTACAYDQFGPDYKFKTQFVSSAEIRVNKLLGNLIILPAQDPSLTSEDIQQMIAVLKNQGIKFIHGNVEIARIAGGNDYFCSAWLAQDWGQDWMPASSNLVLDHNVAPGRSLGHGLPVSNVSVGDVSDALTSSLLMSEWAPAWVRFEPATQLVMAYHPAKSVVGSFVVANPEQYNLAVIKLYLKNNGIKILGNKVVETIEQESVLADHSSKPLSNIIHYILKESDNLYAQQLLRLLGTLPVRKTNLQLASLEEKGLARVSDWLTSIGVEANDVVLFDGCGLSRKDCLTPHALNMVLKRMSATGYCDLLTLDGNGPGGASTFRYKTGAMDSVRAITGIVKTAANEPLALSVIINAHTPSVRELRPALKSLVDHLQSLGKVPAYLLKSEVEPKKKAVRVKAKKRRRR